MARTSLFERHKRLRTIFLNKKDGRSFSMLLPVSPWPSEDWHGKTRAQRGTHTEALVACTKMLSQSFHSARTNKSVARRRCRHTAKAVIWQSLIIVANPNNNDTRSFRVTYQVISCMPVRKKHLESTHSSARGIFQALTEAPWWHGNEASPIFGLLWMGASSAW